MKGNSMYILVIGGAGFVGSHLIDYLIAEDNHIVCVDDLSLGSVENIRHHINNPHFEFIKLNVLNKLELDRVFKGNKFECVFHMAANSDIQAGGENIDVDLEKTFLTTYNILEAMNNNNAGSMVFASSSAIYGELDKPLAEDTGPLFPISFYGAAKLASEAYISAACANYSLKAWIIRFPNVVGERATHGVMFDFINKLRKNPKELVILGDGKQCKPYLYVKDLVEAMLFAWRNSNDALNCFNIAVDSSTTVSKIAEIVVEEMGLKDVKFTYTGGNRGWVGDVPKFRYDLTKINKLGWEANKSSDEAVRAAVKAELGKGV